LVVRAIFFRPTQCRTSWLAGYARLDAANAVLTMDHERVSPTALAEASIRRSPVQGSVIFTLPDSATRSTRTTPQVPFRMGRADIPVWAADDFGYFSRLTAATPGRLISA
jgi:hypothetical protein